MAQNETSPVVTTNQVSTSALMTEPVGHHESASPDLYPPAGPDPSGTKVGAALEQAKETDDNLGQGVEGEKVVWEGRYVMRNFAGRLIWRSVATLVLIGMIIDAWGYGDNDMIVPVYIVGAILLAAWGALAYRIVLARYGHYYRLTTRRLFVSSGLLQRRRDQLELLRVADVFTRQSWHERLLSLGTVVVVSSEKALPTVYLPGVDDPKRVMDLIWHYARAERDMRSVKVQDI